MSDTTPPTNTAAIAALEQALGAVLIRIAKHRAAPLTNEQQFTLRQDMMGLVINAYGIFGSDFNLAKSLGMTLLDAYTP